MSQKQITFLTLLIDRKFYLIEYKIHIRDEPARPGRPNPVMTFFGGLFHKQLQLEVLTNLGT